MCKIFIACLSFAFYSSSFAGTVQDQRLSDVQKLFEKYPCEKFDFEVEITLCKWSREILMLDDSLNLDKNKWRKILNDTEGKLIEWTTEDARIRNKLQPKLGMSKNYIYKHVLGAPESINDTLDYRGQTSQWVYRSEEESMYLYFDNKNILRAIQRSR